MPTELKAESGDNAFTLTPQQWIKATDAIGIISKSGRYGGHYIDLGRTNIDINSKESVYVPIKIGDEIESLDFAISDEYGAEIYNDDIIAELDGRDGNTINLNIYAYCSAGEYVIKVFERDNPSNYKNIYITVNM